MIEPARWRSSCVTASVEEASVAPTVVAISVYPKRVSRCGEEELLDKQNRTPPVGREGSLFMRGMRCDVGASLSGPRNTTLQVVKDEPKVIGSRRIITTQTA